MLFNKDNRGSEELYIISGIFQASAQYESIEAEVDSAINEVRDIIGKDVMDLAEAAYELPVVPEDKEPLVKAVQLPVAYLAISKHAQLSGITHGETGRKIKVDDNEKLPFAWMLDRDDRALRERYYRALDSLYRFLDSSDIAGWNSSATKSMLAHSVIKTLSEFEKVYPLEHSYYMFYMLLPLIVETQNSKLKTIIGEERLAKLLSGDPSVDDIKSPSLRFVALKAMIAAVGRWSVEIFPLSIARRFSPNYQGNKESRLAETDEIEWYLNKLNLQAQDAALDIQTAISGDPYEDISVIPDNNPRKKYFTV